MPYPTYLSQEQLVETLGAVRDFVDNPKNPYVVDRYQLVWASMLGKMSKTVPFIRNQIAVLYKAEADELNMQIWYNKDRLRFQELREGYQLTFNGTQLHMGLEFWHQELKDAGYIIVPNQGRGRNFAKPMSKVDSLRLIDVLKEKIESAMDRWDVLMDQKFLHNVSGNANEPVALTDYISKTPTVGSLGGLDRSNPLVQNPVFLASTAASFERDINRLNRQAMLYNRGFKGSGVNVILASGGWIDRYSDAVRGASSYRREQQVTGFKGKVDIGIGDTQWSFDGTPVVFCPTMDLMATLTGDATWNRRAYGINTNGWVFGHGEREDKEDTYPADPADQRVTRMSIDGRYVLYPTNIRSNWVHEFAA